MVVVIGMHGLSYAVLYQHLKERKFIMNLLAHSYGLETALCVFKDTNLDVSWNAHVWATV